MPQRIQLSRKKGWRKPTNAVVVSRPSKWGNPYKAGTWVRLDGGHLPVQLKTVDDAVKLFRLQATDPEIGHRLREDARRELRGQDLACWCPLDKPCHADVLLEIANT